MNWPFPPPVAGPYLPNQYTANNTLSERDSLFMKSLYPKWPLILSFNTALMSTDDNGDMNGKMNEVTIITTITSASSDGNLLIDWDNGSIQESPLIYYQGARQFSGLGQKNVERTVKVYCTNPSIIRSFWITNNEATTLFVSSLCTYPNLVINAGGNNFNPDSITYPIVNATLYQ